MIHFSDHGNEYAIHDCLQSIVKEAPPKSYLEVGVREGDSLRIVLRSKQLHNLILCDDWGMSYGGTGRGSHRHIHEVIGEHCTGRISCSFLDGDSHELLPTLEPSQFDLITVDGDHSERGALQDLHDAWTLLAPGGLLVFDDIAHPEHLYLNKVIHTFAAEIEGEIIHERLDKKYGVAVLRKN